MEGILIIDILLFHYRWNDKSVWPQGALVKYSRELFRAEGIMNTAVPGDGSQTRFYVSIIPVHSYQFMKAILFMEPPFLAL